LGFSCLDSRARGLFDAIARHRQLARPLGAPIAPCDEHDYVKRRLAQPPAKRVLVTLRKALHDSIHPDSHIHGGFVNR
jgi:hypothetical protein